MNIACTHKEVWSFILVDAQERYCVACSIEYLESSTNPLVKKANILREMCSCMIHNSQIFTHCLTRKEGVLSHFCATLINSTQELQDVENIPTVFECISVLFAVYGEENVANMILHQIISTCYSAQNRTLLYPTKLLLLKILQNSICACQRLINDAPFVKFLSSSLDYPDTNLRMVTLQLCLQLVVSITDRNCVDNSVLLEHALHDFPTKILSLTTTSDNVEILEQSVAILTEASIATDFFCWISGQNEHINTVSEILAGLKRVLLKRNDILTTRAVQCLMVLLIRHVDAIRDPLLNADLAEFVYDALRSTTSHTLISSIYCCILLLAECDTFHTNCHAMYGFESVLRSLQVLLKTAHNTVCSQGFNLLRIILDRQPAHVSILKTLSIFDRTVEIIKDGIKNKHPDVAIAATETASSLIGHFPQSFPVTEVKLLIEFMDEHLVYLASALSGGKRTQESQNNENEVVPISTDDCLSSHGTLLRKLFVAAWNVLYRTCERVLDACDDSKAIDGSDISGVKEAVLDSIENQWLSTTTKTLTAISSPTVIHSMLATIVLVCRSLNRKSLIHKLTTGVFIRLTLTAKSRFFDDGRHESLVNLCSKFLYNLNSTASEDVLGDSCQRLKHLLEAGFSNMRGKISECLRLFDERSNGNENVLATQCAVFCTLFNQYWYGGRETIPIPDLKIVIERYLFLAQSLESIPFSTKKQLLFLYAVINSDPITTPDVHQTILRLLESRENFIHHPVFVSFILRLQASEISVTNIKYSTMRHWLQIQNEFPNDEENVMQIDLLVELSKVNESVALVVVHALNSCNDDSFVSECLVQIIHEFYKHYQSKMDDFDRDIEFCNAIVRSIAEYAYTRISSDVKTSASTLKTILRLLILVLHSRNGADIEIWSFLLRITKHVLVLISDESQCEQEVLEPALCLIKMILSNSEQENQIKSVLTVVFSQKRFTDSLLFWGLNITPTDSQIFFKTDYLLPQAVEIITLLIELQHKFKIPVSYPNEISFSIITKLKLKDTELSVAIFELCGLLYEVEFLSDFIKFNFENDKGKMIRILWNKAMNLTVSYNDKHKTIAFRCAVAIFQYTSKIQSEVMNYLSHHPWLDVVLTRSLEKISACDDLQNCDLWMKHCLTLADLRRKAIIATGEINDIAEISTNEDQFEEMLLSSADKL